MLHMVHTHTKIQTQAVFRSVNAPVSFVSRFQEAENVCRRVGGRAKKNTFFSVKQ